MPLQETPSISKPEGKDFKPLAADVYQVAIRDIELRTGKKYMSEEEQQQLLCKCVVLDEGENRGQYIGVFVTLTWFPGSPKLQASKLYKLFSAVYSHYYKDVDDLADWDIDMVNKDAINDLIGKQFRATVELKEDKNKVTSFLAIKKELPAWEENEGGDTPAPTDDDLPEELR